MPVNLLGYVLEKTRIGAGNSTDTADPDIYENVGAFQAYWPYGSEPFPGTEYAAFVLEDGKLAQATFGWTKNEGGVTRFQYDSRTGRFVPLFGGPPLIVGQLSPSSNTTRIILPTIPIPSLPLRLAVGGTTWTHSFVPTSSAFNPSLPTQHMEISQDKGELNWCVGDLTTYSGMGVSYQGQVFSKTSVALGDVSTPLYLNPIPGTGQFPLIRVGYGLWLTTSECPTEGSFSYNPVTVEWARTTGKLNFPLALHGIAFYDGSLFDVGLTPLMGLVPIERGIYLHVFPSLSDPLSTDPTVKDMSSLYSVTGAILTDSIIQSPYIGLPAPPIDDDSHPIVIHVGQTLFQRLDVSSPPDGAGWILDAGQGAMRFANRVDNVVVPMSDAGVFKLPDSGIILSSCSISMASSGGPYTPLVLGETAVLDGTTGIGSVVDVHGRSITSGTGIVYGNSLTDPSQNFGSLGVVPGDVLISSPQVFRVAQVQNQTTLQLDLPGSGSAYNLIHGTGVEAPEVLADNKLQDVYLTDPSFVVTRTRGGVTTTLTEGTDYGLIPQAGFLTFAQPLLSGDEIGATYVPLSGTVSVTERATFPIRKEAVAAHPTPTSIVTYNSLGREVATNPPPKAFRNGRPQDSTQVTVGSQSITFLPDNLILDLLPHGATVAPDENIRIDYYVFTALGGETSTTLLQPPVSFYVLNVNQGDVSFTAPGDLRTVFPSGYLLYLDNDPYQLGTPTYDGTLTTVNLATGHVFRGTYYKPRIRVSTKAYSSVVEVLPYDIVSYGATAVTLHGRTQYAPGTVVGFYGMNNIDLNTVVSSTYANGVTTLNLTSPMVREWEGFPLQRSLVPILDFSTTTFYTEETPVLTQSVTIFTKRTSAIGAVLTTATLDPTGLVTLSAPVDIQDILYICYTGQRMGSGQVKASYTAAAIPSSDMLGKGMTMDYSTFLPDSFYFRVETLTDLKAEMLKEAKQSTQGGAGGPNLSNGGGQQLCQQGRATTYYTESRLLNEDLLARRTLKWYNDEVNYLETVLHNMDGRVVGGEDGLFLFDGNTNNPPRSLFSQATNQIDDLVKISPFPPPSGTYLSAYLPSWVSRFFPLQKKCQGVVGHGEKEGDPVVSTGLSNLAFVYGVKRATPWSLVTTGALASDTTIQVDATSGNPTNFRPGWVGGMTVVIVNPDGSYIIPEAHPLTISSMGATTLVFLAPIGATVPAGATILLAQSDPGQKTWTVGKDIGVNLKSGELTYIPSGIGEGEIILFTVYLSGVTLNPEIPPALTGGTTDDDGLAPLPLLSPIALCESNSYLYGLLDREGPLLSRLSSFILSLTTFMGTLSPDGLSILPSGGISPSPLIGDLVRGMAVSSGLKEFRKVIAVDGMTGRITVEVAFTPGGGAAQHWGVTSGSSASGVATVLSYSNLQDMSAHFLTTAHTGETLVITSPGQNFLCRRQIIAIMDDHNLALDVALPHITPPVNYRICTDISTFGSVGTDWTTLMGLVSSVYNAVGLEIGALQAFLNLIDPTLISPASLANLQAVWNNIVAFQTANGSFYSAATTAYPVVTSGETPHTNCLTTWADRISAVAGRVAQLPGDIGKIMPVLQATDSFYDTRNVWIDERINGDTGLLAKWNRLLSSRSRTQTIATKNAKLSVALKGG